LKLETRKTKTGGKVYAITEDGNVLAHFERLDTAGTVFRYLIGTPMYRGETDAAREAMQMWDISTGDWW